MSVVSRTTRAAVCTIYAVVVLRTFHVCPPLSSATNRRRSSLSRSVPQKYTRHARQACTRPSVHNIITRPRYIQHGTRANKSLRSRIPITPRTNWSQYRRVYPRYRNAVPFACRTFRSPPRETGTTERREPPNISLFVIWNQIVLGAYWLARRRWRWYFATRYEIGRSGRDR